MPAAAVPLVTALVDTTRAGSPPITVFDWLVWPIPVILFGFAVGAAEIISRYRDDPWRPFIQRSGMAYILVNGIVSLLTFWLLRVNQQTVFPGLPVHWIALIAGFGSMAILRSKFFTIRTASDEDVAIGPEAVVTTLLQAVDRDIDRHQSAGRWRLAYQYLRDVASAEHLALLANHCDANLESYQNVSDRDLEIFQNNSATLRADGATPVGLRAVQVGLLFQGIAGSGNFRDVMDQFRTVAGLPPIARPPEGSAPFTPWPAP